MTQTDIWSAFRASPAPDQDSAWRLAHLEVLRLSGLFDPAFYAARYLIPPDADPLAHYHDSGWRQGNWPNPCFDPAWYTAEYPDVAATAADPLLHYISYGEAEDRRPAAWFDTAWYRRTYAVPAHTHCLRHYLRARPTAANPNPLFDAAWYWSAYPDVAAAAMDPLEHYLVQGYVEGREPSAAFNSRYYRHRQLRGRPDANPLLHALAHPANPIHRPQGEATIPSEVRRFTQPGPDHEPPLPVPPGTPPRATVLAYYLPQFHRIPQNDSWWGAGFTEWSNVARALPRFAGHYQPRIPGELGHYDLSNPDIMRRQIALARGALLGGFIFHFYWFGGTRLLETPLENLLADPTLDFPFCLMWANENWTRRWDGSDDEVLITQPATQDDEAALLADFARHFADPRYVRLAGRPLLMIYRPGLLPDAAVTIARWRARFRSEHGEDPVLVMAQSFGDSDPRAFGLDAATEFPPHRLADNLPRLDHRLDLLDTDFSANVHSYDHLADAACAAPPPPYPLIRAVIPGWDNDARRQGRGLVIHGATPARYQAWLAQTITNATPLLGTHLVCINAWNEWAEGAYLEPDRHFGAAFLNATGRAIAGIPRTADNRLLLVGHDAYPAGAQLLLLHLAQHMTKVNGLRLDLLLGSGGALLDRYQAAAPTRIVADPAVLGTCLSGLPGITRALVNSAASAWCVPMLVAHGITVTLLVHEMPALLADRGLLGPLRAAAAAGATLIYPASAVRDAVAPLLPPTDAAIHPQGLYQPRDADPHDTAALRDTLKLAPGTRLIVGAGQGDHRKGFDLFVDICRRAAGTPDLHFAWAGAIDPSLHATLAADIEAASSTGRLTLLGWQPNLAPLLHAADTFLLTSREDPYPSAALEALAAGIPVIAFAGSGGIPDLLCETQSGTIVPMADCAAMRHALAVPRSVADPSAIRERHRFDRYAAALLRALWPGRPTIAVVVPCHDQAPFLPRRLAGIFNQTHPVHDLVLRDDASTDSSPAVAARIAAAANRSLAIIIAPFRSGSPFNCWADAARRAESDLLWIAEADDDADPTLLDLLAAAMAAPDMLFAVAHSRPIDDHGDPLPTDYTASYAAAAGAGALTRDAIFDAWDFAARFLAERNILFNVSAVLWRRTALLAAMDRLGDELPSWRIAGDWRLYAELLTGTPGRIAYIAAPLNLHRRRPGSVTTRLDPAVHLDEIARMQAWMWHRLGAPEGLAARQARTLAEMAAFLAKPPPHTPR